VFYKNAKGKAARRLVLPEKGDVSDSGVDVSQDFSPDAALQSQSS